MFFHQYTLVSKMLIVLYYLKLNQRRPNIILQINWHIKYYITIQTFHLLLKYEKLFVGTNLQLARTGTAIIVAYECLALVKL